MRLIGFNPRSSGFGSDRSANWATTIANIQDFLIKKIYLEEDSY